MLNSIQLVAFDAVGTLIHPQPGVAEVYSRIAGAHGNLIEIHEVEKRFRQMMVARNDNHSTNETVEKEFWRNTVSKILGPMKDFDSCFQQIYEHFALPEHWVISDGAEKTIQELSSLNVRCCIASNFDERLLRVVTGKTELAGLDFVFLSSRCGWRKPHPHFFELLLRQAALRPSDVLMVGDDLELDVFAAQSVGLNTLLYAPKTSAAPDNVQSISRLLDVLSYCGFHE